MIFDLGDGVELRHRVYNSDRQLTAATVALLVTKPDGTTLTPAVSATSTGVYDAAMFTVNQVGPWAYRWTISGAVVDVLSGGFSVSDPAPAPYVSRDVVKAALGKTTADDRDDLIDAAIWAACRLIDARTGRTFTQDRAATSRIFSAAGRIAVEGYRLVLLIDDIASAEGLVIETGSSSSWATLTGAELGPENALSRGRPASRILFPLYWGGLSPWMSVRVTARWGWPSPPAEVIQAATLLASRLYRRKDSPQGILGSADWGAVRVSRVDPDVEALIAHLVIPGFA